MTENSSSSISSSSEEVERKRKKRRRRDDDDERRRRKKTKERRKRRRRSSESSSSEEETQRRKKKRKRKEREQNHRRLSRAKEVPIADAIPNMESVVPTPEQQPLPIVAAQQQVDPNAKAKSNDRMMIPMTKEAWERQQSQVREIYDEESGRFRLVKGSGEIVERIVSKTDHAIINQTATRGDGSSFNRSILARVKK